MITLSRIEVYHGVTRVAIRTAAATVNICSEQVSTGITNQTFLQLLCISLCAVLEPDPGLGCPAAPQHQAQPCCSESDKDYYLPSTTFMLALTILSLQQAVRSCPACECCSSQSEGPGPGDNCCAALVSLQPMKKSFLWRDSGTRSHGNSAIGACLQVVIGTTFATFGLKPMFF